MNNLPIKKIIHKNTFILLIALTLILLFAVSLYNFNIKNIAFKQTDFIDSTISVNEEIQIIQQNITGLYEDFSKISIPFRLISENQSTDTKATISLLDISTNSIIHSQEISYIDLKSNSNYLFEFDKISNSYNKNYKLEISYQTQSPHSFVPLYSKSVDNTFNIDFNSIQRKFRINTILL